MNELYDKYIEYVTEKYHKQPARETLADRYISAMNSQCIRSNITNRTIQINIIRDLSIVNKYETFLVIWNLENIKLVGLKASKSQKIMPILFVFDEKDDVMCIGTAPTNSKVWKLLKDERYL